MYLTEKIITTNYTTTSRSLDPNSIENLHLNKEVLNKLSDLLSEVLIRFDTNPKCYQKEDYKKLVDLLNKLTSVLTEFLTATSDTESNLYNLCNGLLSQIDELGDLLNTSISNIEYLAGDGIKIENNVISLIPSEPPSDEIWYTTRNSTVENPYTTDALPTILSNTYINGKGVMKFEESVTTIGHNAFYGRSEFTSIVLPQSVTNIEYDAFNGCSRLTSMIIPNSVTSVGINAFMGCEYLTSVILSDNMNTISSNLFSSCRRLISITIPTSITLIEMYAFLACRQLTEITIPNSVTYMQEGVFYNCTNLTSVILGTGIIRIDSGVFDGCNLTSITCHAIEPPLISSDTFGSTPKSIPIYVPAESVLEYQQAQYWNEFTNILPIEEKLTVGNTTITETQLQQLLALLS